MLPQILFLGPLLPWEQDFRRHIKLQGKLCYTSTTISRNTNADPSCRLHIQAIFYFDRLLAFFVLQKSQRWQMSLGGQL